MKHLFSTLLISSLLPCATWAGVGDANTPQARTSNVLNSLCGFSGDGGEGFVGDFESIVVDDIVVEEPRGDEEIFDIFDGDFGAGDIGLGLTEVSEENQNDLAARCLEVTVLLSGDEQNNALLDLAHEEIAAQGRALVEIANGQLSNIRSRLNTIRYGAGRYNLNTLSFNNTQVPLNFAGNGKQNFAVEKPSRWGAFLDGNFGFGQRDASSLERGFDFNSRNVTGGVDYRFNDRLVAGIAGGFASSDLDIDDDRGKIDSRGYSASLYTTYYIKDFYLDAVASYSLNRFDQERNIVFGTVNRTADSNTDADQYALSLGAGYDKNYGALGYGLYAQLNYLDADIDGFDESGAQGIGLSVESQEIRSLISVLGVRTSYAFSTDWGVVVPSARAEWRHEFENESRNIDATFLGDISNTALTISTDNPDEDFFNVGVSAAFVFKNGAQAFFDYETVLGQDDFENHVFSVGARLEF